jgi:hypothetical protein
VPVLHGISACITLLCRFHNIYTVNIEAASTGPAHGNLTLTGLSTDHPHSPVDVRPLEVESDYGDDDVNVM